MMLVLTRGVSETIVIGKAGDVLAGPITITVMADNRGHTRIGIEAERSIGIWRGELYERLNHEGPTNE